MKDFKGQEVEVGDRIVIIKDNTLVEGIVTSMTSTGKNAHLTVTASTNSYRQNTLTTHHPWKTMVIDKGLSKVSDEHAASAADQLREIVM